MNRNQASVGALAAALHDAALRADYLHEQLNADGGEQGFRERLNEQGCKFPEVTCHQFGHLASVIRLSRHPPPSLVGGWTYWSPGSSSPVHRRRFTRGPSRRRSRAGEGGRGRCRLS